jgi:hypothetical protein
VYALFGGSPPKHTACDHFASAKATFPRRGQTRLPVARGVDLTGGEPKIANSELLTAGNVNELRDAGARSQKSFLFFLTGRWPWNGVNPR